MKKKGRELILRGMFHLLIAATAVMTGYFIGIEKGAIEPKSEAFVAKAHPNEDKGSPKIEMKIPTGKESIFFEEETKESREEPQQLTQAEYCNAIENQMKEFFRYLDTKNYIKRLGPRLDTYDRFRRMIGKLSVRSPIPAGEGVDSRIIINNIFYFSRILDVRDFKLIREIVRNETDTLEMNMEIFYQWLTREKGCFNSVEITPPPDILYQYAGFLINTIGGRAYLFRRSTGLRLLISYYCLLIINEADKSGENSYGLDIFPEIAPLIKEISTYPDFQFQKDYIARLYGLLDYYLKKR